MSVPAPVNLDPALLAVLRTMRDEIELGRTELIEQMEKALLNQRLNISQAMLEERIGAAKVTECVAEFRVMAEADPTLFGKLYAQAHPYDWMMREVDRHWLVCDLVRPRQAAATALPFSVLAKLARADELRLLRDRSIGVWLIVAGVLGGTLSVIAQVLLHRLGLV